MTLVESKDKRLVIDCGILFPYEDFFRHQLFNP
jgi:mRNA degradation ribonuclease J1/J2